MINKKLYIAKIFRAEKNSFENKLIATKQATTKKEAIILARQEVITYGKKDLKKEFEWLNGSFASYDPNLLDDIDDTNEILLNDFINDKEIRKNELKTENYYYTIKLFSKKVK